MADENGNFGEHSIKKDELDPPCGGRIPVAGKPKSQDDLNFERYAEVYRKARATTVALIAEQPYPDPNADYVGLTTLLFNRFLDDQIALAKPNSSKEALSEYAEKIAQMMQMR